MKFLVKILCGMFGSGMFGAATQFSQSVSDLYYAINKAEERQREFSIQLHAESFEKFLDGEPEFDRFYGCA